MALRSFSSLMYLDIRNIVYRRHPSHKPAKRRQPRLSDLIKWTSESLEKRLLDLLEQMPDPILVDANFHSDIDQSYQIEINLLKQALETVKKREAGAFRENDSQEQGIAQQQLKEEVRRQRESKKEAMRQLKEKVVKEKEKTKREKEKLRKEKESRRQELKEAKARVAKVNGESRKVAVSVKEKTGVPDETGRLVPILW